MVAWPDWRPLNADVLEVGHEPEPQPDVHHADYSAILDHVNKKLAAPSKQKSILAPYFSGHLEFQPPYLSPGPSPSPSPSPPSTSDRPKTRRRSTQKSGPDRPRRPQQTTKPSHKSPRQPQTPLRSRRSLRLQSSTPSVKEAAKRQSPSRVAKRQGDSKHRTTSAGIKRGLRAATYIRGGHSLRPRHRPKMPSLKVM